jgi:hypothetical protein
MTHRKRLKIELWSLGFATAVTALFAGPVPDQKYPDSQCLSAKRARGEAADYLEAPPIRARFDQVSRRWSVSDGQTTAWLDARSGELIEVEFSPRPAAR